MTFFGDLWALLATLALTAPQRAVLFAIVAAVTAVLSVPAVRTLIQSRGLPRRSTPEASARGRAAGRRYAAVVAVEFVAVFVVANLLGSAGLTPFIPPVVALIVGLHFLPLAAIFGVRAYYLTGALISLVAMAAVALLLGVTPDDPFGPSFVVGLGTAAVLWATAFVLLRAVGR
jgi:hypothetical protein